MKVVIISESGILNQTPSIPKKYGSINPNISAKRKVLANEIIADTFPLEKAVNIADAKILIPTNKNAIENNFSPCIASMKTGLE